MAFQPLSRGDNFKINLGTPGTVNFTVGSTTVSATDVPVNEWSLLSLRNDDGKTTVNGKNVATQLPPVAISDEDVHLLLGGGFTGCIDEVRIWGKAIPGDFNYFEHTTLNNYNPYWEDLLVYYKMDQELCDNLVDYKGIYSPDSRWNHHGIMSAEGVKRVEANNPKLPYLINSAYTANERFFDRAIPRDQYLFSNDLIILGVQSYADGHVRTCTPNNHATLEGSAKWIAEYEGRSGVMSFDGNGYLQSTNHCLLPESKGWTFETWLYIDEWVEGAYIFRKESDDATKGIAIYLGDESRKEIIVRINGKKFPNIRKLKSQVWTHVGISIEGGGLPYNTLVWVYDGKNVGSGSNDCDDSTDAVPTGHDNIAARIGEGFKGKIDNFAVIDYAMGRSGYASHLENLPMPALNKMASSDFLQKVNTLYTFDDPTRPGYSSWSQDEWRDIMIGAYEGHRGFQVRISVKSHDGWLNTVANANRRKIFAADLAKIAEGYDGVELDLEWMYGTQTNLGLLAEEIRAALPEGKSLMISCHNVAYGFPVNKMDNCDGFTFQQYGPQRTHSYYSHFVSMTQAFINYGFPREKILCSYATTTSDGHKNGVLQSGAPIKGVRDNFMEEGFVPDEEVDVHTVDGNDYYFDGPLQTYKRAKYVTDQRLGGIFYWDMGNDVRPEHPYNLAKWSTYGLCGNVDSLVTKVDVRHFTTAIPEVLAERASAQLNVAMGADGNSLIVSFADGTAPERCSVVNLNGSVISTGTVEGNRLDIADLHRGVYILSAYRADGRALHQRFIKR